MKMKNLQSMCSLIFGVLIWIHSSMGHLNGVTTSMTQKKPHIIILMADDLGWNDVSYHGSNQIPTPNIDALAYNGIILHNFYTQPVCTPSRASFLTGRYAIRTGLQGNPLDAGSARALPLSFTLFPEYFHNLGYSTNLIGKWHLGHRAKEFLPTSRGFDNFYGFYNGYIRYFNYTVENAMGYSGYDLHRDVGQNYTVDWSPKNVYATDLFTTEAENVIANHDPDVPLYLHFSHLAPHASNRAGKLEVRDIRQVDEKFAYISNNRRRLYAGMVSALDESIGRVVEALNKKGMLNDSIIVFMSDNGAMSFGFSSNGGSNYPYRGRKSILFEGGVHVPALIWSPIIKNASRIHRGYFHITDWLPTLYKLAGGNINDLGSIDGIDQWNSIADGSPSNRDTILLSINELNDMSGAIKGRFKYLSGELFRYSRYTGENVDDGDLSAPPYNTTSVTNSMAALAITNTNGTPKVSEDNILQLRRANKVVCAPHKNRQIYCKNCLFDILADPCEVTDVSKHHPEVVKELMKIVEDYKKVLVPQVMRGLNRHAFPDYQGGPWLPWSNVHGEPLPRPLSTVKSIVNSHETEAV